MTAPVASDHRIYPDVCLSCPLGPRECLESMRTLCESTQRLVDELQQFASPSEPGRP